MKINKLDLIGWIVMMPEDDRRLDAVNRIRLGLDAELEDAGPCLRVGEAAKRAGISRYTIWRAAKTGALIARPLYPGGARVIRETDFRRWLAGRWSADARDSEPGIRSALP